MLDLIRWRAARAGDLPALFFDGRWSSYQALDAEATRLAQALRAAGCVAGDRVAVLAANHRAHLLLSLAAPKLGVIAAPLNYRLAQDEIADCIASIRPRLALADTAHAALLPADVPTQALASYADWLAAAPPGALPAPTLSRQHAHLLLFTGGSTGRPKAAVLPYAQTLGNAEATASHWGLSERDCTVQVTPCFHAGIHALALPLLFCGGRVVLPSSFVAEDCLAAIAEHRATVIFMVPTMYQRLLESPAFAGTDLSSLRWAISGGAPCPPPLREAFAARGLRFKQGYGLTEAGVNCFCIDLDTAARKPHSVGRPMPGIEAVLRGADGAPVPAGEVGELTLRTAMRFSGYFERPEATAEMLRGDWLWTGDFARVDEDGDFTIVGRRREMFISGGENIYPAEVEAALWRCPGVIDCAVLSEPCAHWGERGVAFVVAAARLDETALRTALRGHLAAYKMPHRFIFVAELPRTAAGKVARPQLRRWLDGDASRF